MLFPLDDAYITLHNAQVLLSGRDINYGVPALYGATSPIHLALVAAVGLALPLPLASLAVNLLADALYGVGLWRLCENGSASGRWRALIVAVGIAAAGPHLFNGLETGMALAGVAWSLVLAARNSRIGLPLLLGALPFIRPDLAPLSVALMAWRALSAARQDARGASAGLKLFLEDAALALLAAAPWLAWTWMSVGSPLPATMTAKRLFFAEQLLPLAEKARMAALAVVESLLAPLLLMLLAARNAPLVKPIFAFALFFLAAYTAVLPGALAHNAYRYLAPLCPLCLYGLRFIAADLRRAASVGLAALLALYVAVGVQRVTTMYSVTADGETAAAWAGANLAPDARILVHDAGIPAWETSLHLVDLVGLKSPASIAEHMAWTAPSAGRDRGEAISQIALASHATHAIVLNDIFWGEIGEDLRRRGWGLRALREPKTSPGYTIYELTPPAARLEANF